MKIIKIIITVVLMYIVMPEVANGQPPLPPGNGHNSIDNSPPGAGAPVGSGAMILLTLSAGYGVKKMLNARKKKNGI